MSLLQAKLGANIASLMVTLKQALQKGNTIGLAVLFVCQSMMTGCASTAWQRASAAAIDTFKEPAVWVPAAGAALLLAADADNSISDFARNTPLFGSVSAASDASDLLVDILVISASLTSFVPEKDKLKRLGLNAITLSINHSITSGIKRVSKRERPNKHNAKSFPSLHASNAFTAGRMTINNMHGEWSDSRQRMLITGVAVTGWLTAWARMEAGQHHASDVLIGAALGTYVSNWMNSMFLAADPDKTVTIQLIDKGALVRFSQRLP